jgi:hypothetical protein
MAIIKQTQPRSLIPWSLYRLHLAITAWEHPWTQTNETQQPEMGIMDEMLHPSAGLLLSENIKSMKEKEEKTMTTPQHLINLVVC